MRRRLAAFAIAVGLAAPLVPGQCLAADLAQTSTAVVKSCSVEDQTLRASTSGMKPSDTILFSMFDADKSLLAFEWLPRAAPEIIAPLLWSWTAFPRKVERVECQIVSSSGPDSVAGQPISVRACDDPKFMHVDQGATADFTALAWGHGWLVASVATGYEGMISGNNDQDPAGAIVGLQVDDKAPVWLVSPGRQPFSAAFFDLAAGPHEITVGVRDVALPTGKTWLFALHKICVTL